MGEGMKQIIDSPLIADPSSLSKVSVIVPTRNRHEKLLRTIRSLQKQTLNAEDYEIIVVDDGSTKLVEISGVKVLRLEGVERSVARNTGAKEANGELLVFVDDDMEVSETFLEEHLKAFNEWKDALLVGRVSLSEEFLKTPFGQFRQNIEQDVVPLKEGLTDVQNLCTAQNMSIGKERFFALGGFDSKIVSCEDQDFALRHRAKAGRTAFVAKAVAIHHDDAQDIRAYCKRCEWGMQNMIPYCKRHADFQDNIEREAINGFVKFGREPFLRSAKKIIASILSLKGFVSLLFFLTALLKRFAPNSSLLKRFYSLLIGLHNFRGYRKGLENYNERAAMQLNASITTPSSDKVFFPNLDGLRFLSFFIVFLCHSSAEVINNLKDGGFVFTTLKFGVFQSAQLGVSFFFVLSGFLITYLLIAEQKKRGRVDVKLFYVRRALRIWPLYFALLIFNFTILPLIVSINLPDPLLYFLFLSNFDVIATGGVNNLTDITWSVAIEEQFYFVWPLLFFLLNPRYYRFIFPTIIIISAGFRFKYGYVPSVRYFHTFSVMSELAIGGLSAYLAFNFPRFIDFFRTMPSWLLLFAYSLILPLLIFNRFLYAYSTIGKIVLGVVIAFIILEQNYSKNSIVKMERLKTISEWGRYTYGLYLLHPLVIFFVLLLAQKQGWDSTAILPGIFIGIVCFAVSVFVCYLSYNYFEKPFLDLKKRFSHIQTGPTTAKKSIEVNMESELDADSSALRTG